MSARWPCSAREGYALIPKRRAGTGESVGTGLTNPDVVAFAESFGIDGYRPTSPGEVEDALDEAVSNDRMALVEVAVE